MATADVAQRPSSAVGSQYDPDAYDICRPTIPIPENETDSEKIDRMQREFEALRDCVNAELKVRPETSLLGLILLKVVLPFAAIAAGFTAIYAGALRAGNADKGHTELFFGIGYAILVAGAVMLLRSLRKPGAGGHGDSISTSMRNALKLTVPPSKEKLTRNKLVNNWIFFWLTWGLIIGLPVIFFLFRSDALDRAGLHLTFDTANVCAPTADGFNPYEGSDVCDNRGYTYVDSKDVATSTTTGVGSDEGVESLQVAPSRTAEEFNTAEVRMDVTTTLVLYFLILIVGILVNMVRWWRKDKQRNTLHVQSATPPST